MTKIANPITKCLVYIIKENINIIEWNKLDRQIQKRKKLVGCQTLKQKCIQKG